MLNTIGKDPQRQGLRLRTRLLRGTAIRKNPREIGDLSDPAAVIFPFQFNLEGHVYMIPRAARPVERCRLLAAEDGALLPAAHGETANPGSIRTALYSAVQCSGLFDSQCRSST
jgi:hypothetical protein